MNETPQAPSKPNIIRVLKATTIGDRSMDNGTYLLTMSCVGLDVAGETWTWTEIDMLGKNGRSLSHEEFGYLKVAK